MYGVLFVFLLFTDPRELPVYVLIAPILWLFMCMTFTILLILSRMQLSKVDQGSRNFVYAMSFSGLVCTVILLRSVNQLNGRDLLLVVVFLVIASFYATKLRISRKAK